MHNIIKQFLIVSTFIVSSTLLGCGGGGGVSGGGNAGGGTTPVATQQTIEVTVTGLSSGASLTLTDNGTNTLSIGANGTFPFSTPVATNSTYVVAVANQPTGQNCTVSNGSATASSTAINNVNVACTNLIVTPPLPSTPYVTANVSVVRTNPGQTLDSNFVGLSYEKSKMSQAMLSSSNTALVKFFKLLGPGVIRIGGNSVNTTTWNASGAGLASGYIAPADIDRVASLLSATGWKVIYGLNHVTNTNANIASEAQYAAQKFGTALLGFEIGNEPDLYHDLNSGVYTSSYTFSSFLAQWKSYQAAILAVLPNAVFTGPASSYNISGYTVPFAQQAGSQINLLTQHYYRANGQSATSTLALLLAGDPNLPTQLQTLNNAAKAAGVPYRLAEANSFYNGGAPNISDAYGTALWVLDFLFINAQNGSSGVNMHGGGTGPYTPITDNGTIATGPRPEFYGLYLFSLMENGQLLNTTTNQTGSASINFTTYAVSKTDGSTAVLLNNKDATNSAYTTINLNSTKATTATLSTLTGIDLSSTTGFTLNGALIGNDGTWSGGTANTINVSTSGILTVVVPPMSAVLVQTN